MKQVEILKLGCALDISKDKFACCFGYTLMDNTFKVKSSRNFNNTRSGIRDFISWLDKLCSKYDERLNDTLQVLMEPTGVYHENVRDELYKKGYWVCIETPRKVKLYMKSIGHESKTDKLDAKGLCQMSCERKFKKWEPFSENTLALRDALRHRKALMDTKLQASNRLHAQKHKGQPDKIVIASLKRLIKQMDKEIERIEQYVMKLYQEDGKLRNRVQKIIDSFSGLGYITVLTVVCETNGFANITGRKQLASYAGYDIIENQSGQTTRRTKISKRGNARIRRELYMAASATIKSGKHKFFVDFHRRIRERNPKVKMIAHVAVQRKLLLLIYSLFKNNTCYDEQYHLTTNKKSSPEGHSELHEIVPANAALLTEMQI